MQFPIRWDEDVLEEVARWRAFVKGGESDVSTGASRDSSNPLSRDSSSSRDASNLRRRTLAGMLSEALCQRARRVSEMRAGGRGLHVIGGEGEAREKKEEMETPFSRRAREQRKPFAGGLGKRDGEFSFIGAWLRACCVLRGVHHRRH